MGQWGLAAAVLIGLALRFLDLDLKPLWLDETRTLLFSLGHRYEDLPRGVLLPLNEFLGALAWRPQSCAAITRAVIEQATHPPLFFCGMHLWLGQFPGLPLRWSARALPALCGVGAIVAMYRLNRVAFSPTAGLWAALLMAVSPFAVYLSQEARHYTLPMLVVTLSLIAFVRLGAERSMAMPSRRGVWMAWVGWNSLGFYIHYFCLLAFTAQAVVLLLLAPPRRPWRQWPPVAVGVGLYGLSVAPWLPVLITHAGRPETDWLVRSGDGLLEWIGPLARLVGGVILTVVFFPVERQPLAIVILSGAAMLVIAVGLGHHLWARLPRLLRSSPGAAGLGLFLLVVWVEYLVLVYGLNKDLTLAFRYNFVFYPALCALLAAGLTAVQCSRRWSWGLLGVGLISSGFVVTDLAFQKPYAPAQTAARLLQQAAPALVVIQDYRSALDQARGLTTAFAVQQLRPASGLPIEWALVDANARLETRLSEFGLWHIGAARADRLNTISWGGPVHGTDQQPGFTCTAAASAQRESGMQYQRSRCR